MASGFITFFASARHFLICHSAVCEKIDCAMMKSNCWSNTLSWNSAFELKDGRLTSISERPASLSIPSSSSLLRLDPEIAPWFQIRDEEAAGPQRSAADV